MRQLFFFPVFSIYLVLLTACGGGGGGQKNNSTSSIQTNSIAASNAQTSSIAISSSNPSSAQTSSSETSSSDVSSAQSSSSETSSIATSSSDASSTQSSSSETSSARSSNSSSSLIPIANLRINEAVASNAVFDDDDGDDSDWLELYNGGSTPINLDGWTITDNNTNPEQWTFPAYELAPNEHLIVWASGKNRSNVNTKTFHTNFKISSEGETIFIYDNTGRLVSNLAVNGLVLGYSIGISNTLSNNAVYFDTPTPGAANANDEYLGIVTSSPIFSHNGGTDSPSVITLSGANTNEEIRFSTDGSIPNESSSLYNAPISITENTVIRARIFKNNLIPSVTISRTFLPDASHDIAVVTLATEPDNFFHNDTGIYVLGDTYEAQQPFKGANFWEEWEKDISFSFYEPNGTYGASFDGGVKIFGGWSRANDQRSLALHLRSRYGANNVNYSFFPQLAYSNFKALVLRNSGNDWLSTMMRDDALTSLMNGTGLDVQAFRPVAVYLNKEYWGMYNLREKVNEHFIASKHNILASDVSLLEGSGEIVEGSNIDYLNMMEFIRNNSLADSNNYATVAAQMDIENFTIYQIAQIYFNNRDWPGNNIKFWKSPTTKWRWILYDTDFGFGIWNANDVSADTLSFALATDGPNWPNPPWSTLLLRRLMENTEFKHGFINRFADELNSRFLPTQVSNHIDSIANVIASEMPKQFSRWGSNSAIWPTEVQKMKNFGNGRTTYLWQHIKNKFSLGNIYTLTITNNNLAQGQIKLNSLNINSTSWTGNYFENIPISLTAVPKTGFRFSHWQTGSTSENSAIQLNLSANTNVTAVFIAE